VLHGTPILVSAARGDDRAGVRRDEEGHLWIATWTVERPGRVVGTRLEGLDPAQIGGPGWWVVGARLPEGVRSVEARDEDGAWHAATVANGAWVAFVAGAAETVGMPPLRMRDAAGELVSRVPAERRQAARRLQPGEAQALTISRAGAGPACPACGANDWRAAPAGSGAVGERVFCAVCGHDDGGVRSFFAATRR
jgi:Zn ribbon nucleic-acid-binding protein